MPTAAETELLELSRKLLVAINDGDWDSYADLCDENLTCFEPEAEKHLVTGMPFHRYYFELPRGKNPKQSTISSPDVRVVGDIGIVCYVRLIQNLNAEGVPVTAVCSETRIWQRINGNWKHVHFHRS